VNLALGVLLLWLGSAALWVAFHGTSATNPWDAYVQVTSAINKQVDS
jgi:membrane protein implicated in regulation of membrane protease activity